MEDRYKNAEQRQREAVERNNQRMNEQGIRHGNWSRPVLPDQWTVIVQETYNVEISCKHCPEKILVVYHRDDAVEPQKYKCNYCGKKTFYNPWWGEDKDDKKDKKHKKKNKKEKKHKHK